jgi:hypothetical protein
MSKDLQRLYDDIMLRQLDSSSDILKLIQEHIKLLKRGIIPNKPKVYHAKIVPIDDVIKTLVKTLPNFGEKDVTR